MGLSEAALAELNELDATLNANPLAGYNNPDLTEVHSKQVAFHASKAPVKVFLGGRRAGKSTAGVVDDLIQALTEDMVPSHLLPFKQWQPPFRCRVITPDLGHTLQVVLDALRRWCPPIALHGGTWDAAYAKDKRLLSFVNGSRFDFMSYETDLDKFGGVALHRVHYDEEPAGEKGEAIRSQGQSRLRDYEGQEIFTFTPENGISWSYDAFWENRGEEVEERVWSNDELLIVRAASFDNPNIPPEGVGDAEMTAEEYKVKVLGEFFHIKGLVYPEFDEQTHVVDPPSLDHVRGLDTLVGIDPGIRTTGVVFCGFDRDNSMLVYDELALHEDAAIPENAAREIKQKLSLWGVDEARYVIDPSSRNRSLVNADDVQAAFMREGIPATPGQNAVEAGVFEIKRRLQHDPPVFLVSRACETFIWELRRYRMDDKPDGSFAVVKRDDHLADAARYCAMERTWWQDQPRSEPAQQTYRPNFQPPYKSLVSRKETPPTGVFS